MADTMGVERIEMQPAGVGEAAGDRHPGHLLPRSGQIFRRNYNRSAFVFRHGLRDHPLLGLPAVIDLARRLGPDVAYWSNGTASTSDGWTRSPGPRQPLVATLENIAHNDSLVLLRSVASDDKLGPLMRQVHTAILDHVGPALSEDMAVARAAILIASPRRITPYHIDGGVNFLMQVRGSKTLSVFDQTDRNVLPEMEIEQYFAGDPDSAIFKADHQRYATRAELRAGFGAHVPCLAPHWARNGDDVSIAVSFSYDLRSIERLAEQHKANTRLRFMGLERQPATDDQSPTWLPRAAGRALSAIRTTIHTAAGHLDKRG